MYDGIVVHATARVLLDKFLEEPSHAVLLAGPLGMGKAELARQLAATLLGTDSGKLENQAYFTQVSPTKDSISIEQIRELIKFFRLMVPSAERIKRVAVIQQAESMGREAQNALLKLLEEPPVGSVLLLVSSYPDQLLPTIRSRTQMLVLPAPDPQTLRAHFISQGHDEDAVQRALLRAGSNMTEAGRLLAAGSSQADEPLQLVKQVLTGTSYDRMLLVDGLAKQREQASVFIDTLAAAATAGLHSAATKNPGAIARWQGILGAANTAGDALERNGSAKLVLTELMLAL